MRPGPVDARVSLQRRRSPSPPVDTRRAVLTHLSMGITVKRVYEKPGREEGIRVLVDRLWPRGLSKDDAAVDLWLKDLAPSHELRRWYGHDSRKWPEFRRRYFAELDGRADSVRELARRVESGDVVLLYGSKEPSCNNAVALKEYLESLPGR